MLQSVRGLPFCLSSAEILMQQAKKGHLSKFGLANQLPFLNQQARPFLALSGQTLTFRVAIALHK